MIEYFDNNIFVLNLRCEIFIIYFRCEIFCIYFCSQNRCKNRIYEMNLSGFIFQIFNLKLDVKIEFTK